MHELSEMSSQADMIETDREKKKLGGAERD